MILNIVELTFKPAADTDRESHLYMPSVTLLFSTRFLYYPEPQETPGPVQAESDLLLTMVKFAEQEYPQHPFLLSIKHLAELLGTNVETGSTSKQAVALAARYGCNKLEGEGGVQWQSVLLKQISNAMILVCIPRVSLLRLWAWSPR